jgi:hypothetical protein
MDDQVSGQAAQAGDDQAPQGGHEIPLVPEKEVQAPEREATPSESEEEDQSSASNEDAKARRISSKKWQEMAEKVKDFDKFKAALAESLGVKAEEVTEEDATVVLKKEIESLKEETKRKDWEAEHPHVRSKDVKEDWDKIVKEKGHLVRSGDLSYDDLWRLVRKEQTSTTPQDYRSQELAIGSIPSISKTPIVESDIDPDVYKVMKAKGYTDAQIKMSGAK